MILLSQFKEESQKREDQGKIYNYFVQMILLLSDLCLERNFTAITPLQTIYTFDQCMTIVRRDDLYDLPMRNAFIRLLTHLWIDVRLISL
jgi:hypothetical protein